VAIQSVWLQPDQQQPSQVFSFEITRSPDHPICFRSPITLGQPGAASLAPATLYLNVLKVEAAGHGITIAFAALVTPWGIPVDNSPFIR